MVSEYNVESNGVVENGNANGRDDEYVEVANKRKMMGLSLFMRVAAVVLSLAAAVVMGLDKLTKVVAMPLGPKLPPVNVSVTAEWHYLSAFVYFVAANAVVSAYGAISLLLILTNRDGKRKNIMRVVVLDLATTSLLFTSFGAAGAVGFEGNSHVQWRKVCNVFEKFCIQGAVAMILSGGASFIFFLLVSKAILNLNKK